MLDIDRLQRMKIGEANFDELQRQNSFDAIRLIAAFGVFYGHQLLLAGRSETLVGPIGISSLSLFVFFALSGYLIYQSLVRHSTLRRYAQARILRIWPAYIVNILFCVGLGAAIGTLPVAEFLRSADTLKFVGINMTVVLTPTRFILPGVLENAPWRSINGSVWTIKYEILAYVTAFALYRLGGARYQHKFFVLFALLLVVNYILCVEVLGPWFPATVFGADGQAFFAQYNYYNVSRFFLAFFFGAALSASEPLTLRLRLILLGLIVAMLVLFYGTELTRLGTILLL